MPLDQRVFLTAVVSICVLLAVMAMHASTY